MKRLTKSHLIFFTFFMLIVANSRYLIDQKLSSYFEYFALGLLTLEILYTFFKQKNIKKKQEIILFIVTTILFSIGIILQGLPIISKLRLVFTMIALASFMLFSKFYLNDYKYIRTASYGMIFGMIATTAIGLVTGTSVLKKIYDNILFIPLRYGFTGGMQFKNNFASTVLACMIGLLFYYKYIEKKKIDFFAILILIILEILSGSKGSLVLLFLFFSLIILEKYINLINNFFKRSSKRVLFIFKGLMIIILIFSSIFIYNCFLSKSNTYAYRIRGVQNYLSVLKDDHFHLFFGYSSMAFKNGSGNIYINNIRSFIKSKNPNLKTGSYEAGFINTLIKNGVLGLIGFALVYIWIVKKALALKKAKREKILIIGIFIILLVSSLVESYVCNIHQIFGIYCYLVMNGLLYIGQEQENKKDEIE